MMMKMVLHTAIVNVYVVDLEREYTLNARQEGEKKRGRGGEPKSGKVYNDARL